MRGFTRCAFAFVAAIVTVVVSEPSDLTDSQVTVLKCCRHNEKLQVDNVAGDGLPPCVQTLDAWKPLIYSTTRQTLDSNMPANWHVVDGRRPKCNVSSVLAHVS